MGAGGVAPRVAEPRPLRARLPQAAGVTAILELVVYPALHLVDAVLFRCHV